MNESKPRTPIGALDGAWSILFRIALVTFLPWSIWITVEQFNDRAFRQYGERFSIDDFRLHVVDEAAALAAFEHRIDIVEIALARLPPDEFEAKVDAIAEDVAEIRVEIARIKERAK